MNHGAELIVLSISPASVPVISVFCVERVAKCRITLFAFSNNLMQGTHVL